MERGTIYKLNFKNPPLSLCRKIFSNLLSKISIECETAKGTGGNGTGNFFYFINLNKKFFLGVIWVAEAEAVLVLKNFLEG